MQKNLESQILGSILIKSNYNAEFLKEIELESNFFSRKIDKKIFKEIQSGNSSIDLIPECFPSKDRKEISEYLGDIITGIQSSITIEEIRNKISKINQERLKTETLSLIEKGCKTGNFNFSGIRKNFEKIESLYNGNKPKAAPLSQIESHPLRWLWLNKIPSGCLSLFVGDPGMGKGILMGDLMARVSNGSHWPFLDSHVENDFPNGKKAGPGTCVLLSSEDNPHDTIRPRAEDAGADLDKILLLTPKKYTISNLINELKTIKKSTPDLTLVVIDPLADFMGNIKGNSNSSIRSELNPLLIFAQKQNLTILGIQHLNKDQAKKAIYRTLDSIAYIAAARSVWLIQKDEDDYSGQRRFFSPIKANVCKSPTTLAFSIDGPLGHPMVTWESKPTQVNPDELLGDPEKKERMSSLEEAKKFLIKILRDGPIESVQVIKEAEDNGISKPTLNRAKSILKINSFRKDQKWYMEISK